MQAPKGGVTIAGVFYKGGQFLPSDYEPKHGKYNRPNTPKKAAKVPKSEVAPYVWEERPEGKRSIYIWVSVAGIKIENGVMSIPNPNIKAMNYYGLTEEKANELVTKWNNGERWV